MAAIKIQLDHKVEKEITNDVAVINPVCSCKSSQACDVVFWILKWCTRIA